MAAPLVVPASALGLSGAVAPSNRIVFANIGIGGRARHVMPNFLSQPDLVFTAVSDCREDRMKSAKELIDTHYGNKDCRMYHDFRELLAQKDIDAVFIATGDRWHTTASVFAARAGKDIYCEKPISMTISEGRSLVEACRRAWHDLPGRHAAAFHRVVSLRRGNGALGPDRPGAHRGDASLDRSHHPALQAGPGSQRPGLRHLARPVQWRPYVPARVEGGAWNYFWDTGEGPIIGMGCHYVDQMQWALERDHTGPLEFEGTCVARSQAVHERDARAGRGSLPLRGRHQRSDVFAQTFSDRYIRFIGDEAGSGGRRDR